MKLVTLLLAPALMLGAGAARATCPASDYNITGNPQSITAPLGSDQYNYNDGYGDYGTSAIDFTIPGAMLDAGVSSFGYGQSTAELDVVDDFNVIGVPSGTPVSLTAQLTLNGDGVSSQTATASVMGSIQDAHGHSAQTTGISYHGTLSLPLSETAGQTFRLTFSVSATCYLNASTRMTGHFSFSGLPTGAVVVSCEGYASDPTVPAHGTTWGKVKAIYR